MLNEPSIVAVDTTSDEVRAVEINSRTAGNGRYAVLLGFTQTTLCGSRRATDPWRCPTTCLALPRIGHQEGGGIPARGGDRGR